MSGRARVTARWRASCHEAGHAVAVLLFGGRVLSATVGRHVANDGRVLRGRVRWVGDLSPWQQAIVAAAGVAAELRTFTGTYRRVAAAERLTHGAARDLAHLEALAATDGGLDVDEALRWAGVLVEVFAARIVALATALDDAGALDEAGVLAAVGEPVDPAA